MMTLAGSIHRFIQNRYRIRTTDALPAAADVALKGRERERKREEQKERPVSDPGRSHDTKTRPVYAE